MDLSQLSNYGLYEIIQNEKLDKKIRALANNEFTSRKLTNEQLNAVIRQHDQLFTPEKSEPLSLKYKIIALIIPFFWVVHVLMTSRYLARGQKRKWNEYWLFFCIGLVLWTVGLILAGRYLMNK